MPDLHTLLKYKNTHVLNRYSRDFPKNKLSSQEALTELLKFFWLCLKHEDDKIHFPGKRELNFTCGIHYEMKEIDDMWHTFLLFTKDYSLFCEKYLGKYFHHTPNTDTAEITKDDFENDLTNFLSYIYDHLGKKTLLTWFDSLIESHP